MLKASHFFFSLLALIGVLAILATASGPSLGGSETLGAMIVGCEPSRPDSACAAPGADVLTDGVAHVS